MLQYWAFTIIYGCMSICYEIVKTLVRMLVLLQVGKCSNEADKENKKCQRKDDKDQEFIM